MPNNFSPPWLVGGVWFAILGNILTCSVAIGASLSTTALLLLTGVIPAIIVVLVGVGTPSPAVAEIVPVEAPNGRSL